MMARVILAALAAACLSACGSSGGGSNDNAGANPPPPTGSQVSGVFVDSPVAGLGYESVNGSGVTTDNGGFTAAGTITFVIGDIVLGSAPVKAVLTPADLVAGASEESDPAQNATVTNIIRLLQTLDQDERAANGIRITSQARQAGRTRTLNFNQPIASFAQDAAVQAFLLAAKGSGNQQNATPVPLIPIEQAREHLRATLAHIAAFDVPNQLPTANAGPDQSVDSGVQVVLDGGASQDTDTLSPNNPIRTYNWLQVSGPVVDLAPGAVAAQRRFTPRVAGDSVLVFELTVTDDDGGEHSDRVSINVRARQVTDPGDNGGDDPGGDPDPDLDPDPDPDPGPDPDPDPGNDNVAPVAQDASFNTIEDQAVTAQVSASDADDDDLELFLVDAPQNGLLQFAPGGNFTYTPNTNYVGSDFFTFKANDGAADSNLATVTLNVNAIPVGRVMSGAAKRSVTPRQEHIDGVSEPRFAGAPQLQRFNLGGFGINPLQNFPDPIGGFGAQITEPAGDRKYLDDDIWVRTLIVTRRNADGSDTRLAFITLDATGAGNIIQAGLKAAVNAATGIPENNILFGQTHSHAGADLQGLWGGVPQSWIDNPEAGNGLYQLAADAAREAMNNLREARMSVSARELPQFNNYRRPQIDPNAQADATATLLRLRATEDNALIGSLLQYNAHPTNIGANDDEGVDSIAGRVAHPDYITGVTQDLESEGGVALFYNGPIADASSASGGATAGGNAYEDARNRGLALAEAARAGESEARILSDDISIRHLEAILPVTNPLFVSAGLLGSFNRYYDFTQVPFADIPGIGPFVASQASTLPQATPSASTLVSRITLGSGDDALEIVTIPGEATNTFGEYIQALAGKQTMLLGLTQNSFGYILPEEEFSYINETGETGLAVPFTNYEEFISLGPLTAPLLRLQAYNPLFDAPPEANVPPSLAACLGVENGEQCILQDLANRPAYYQQAFGQTCRENDLPDEFCRLIDPGALPALAEICRDNGGPDALCDVLDIVQLPQPGEGGELDPTLITAALDASLRGCDLLDPAHCMMPFPSDQFTKSAASGTIQSSESGGTGRQININILGMPRNLAGKPVDPTEWNRNDGFSPGQMIITVVPGLAFNEQTGAVPDAPPLTNIQTSLFDENASVMVIDAETGARHLVWAEVDLNAPFLLPAEGIQAVLPQPPALIIRPAKNFIEGHRYIVVLRNMQNAQGGIIPANPAFAACRDQVTMLLPQVNARCAELEQNVFAPLAAISADNDLVDVARDDSLFLAWDFTVASENNLTARMLHMRDDAFASLEGHAPAFTVDEVIEAPNPLVARRIRGSFTVPSYLILPDATPVDTGSLQAVLDQFQGTLPSELDPVFDGLDLVTNANLPPNRLFYNPGDGANGIYGDGLPDRTGDLTVEYTCNVPQAAVGPEGAVTPARASLYGHGLLGSGTEVNNTAHVASMGDAHNVMFCATDWYGFASADVPNVLTALVDFSLFPLVPDGSQQGVLNFMFLARLLNSEDGFVSNPAFQANNQPLFDRREVFYDGNSQGGILGGVVIAASPDVHRGVLGVPGMNYSTLLRRSVDFDTFAVPLYLSYQNTLDRTFLFSFMEMLWERSENNGYAAHINHDPLPDLNGEPLPNKRVLLHPAYSDHQVTMWSADVMARTILAAADGSRTTRHPDQVPFDFLDPIENEYTFDAATNTRRFDGSALVIWDEPWSGAVDARCVGQSTPVPPVGNVPPRLGDDPHECPRREVAAQCQKSHFMHPNGAVVDVSDVTSRALCPSLPPLGTPPGLPDVNPPDEEDPENPDTGGNNNPLAFIIDRLDDRLDPQIIEQAGDALGQCQLNDNGPNCVVTGLLATLQPGDAVVALNELIDACAATPLEPVCGNIDESLGLPDRLPLISELVSRGDLIKTPLADNPQARNPAGSLDDWVGRSSRIAGAARFDAGEHIYTDYIFDAYGADDGSDAQRLAIFAPLGDLNSRLTRLDQLFQAAGAQFGAPPPVGVPDHYGDATDLADEADLHDLRWAASGNRLLMRAQTTTMTDASRLGVLVLADTDSVNDTGDARPVGFGTGLSTTIFDIAVLITQDGAVTCTLSACNQASAINDANVMYEPGTNDDEYLNAVQASLPVSLLAPNGQMRVAVVVGPRSEQGITPANVAYRFDEIVAGAYQEQGQAIALFNGNIDAFTADIAVADLLAGRSESARPGPGYHERQFLSGANISSEGGENGRLQHYGLFVPSSYAPQTPAVPLTFWLHYRGGKAHVGASYTPRLITQLGEEQGNIVVTPRARGTSTWYVSEAHQDFFEVYADAHDLFANIDPNRRYLSGYSMGGYGTYLFGLLYPDLFAAGYSTSGATTQGAWTGLGPDDAVCNGLSEACYIQANGGDAAAQLTWRILENARQFPLVIHHGSNDELVPITGVLRYGAKLARLGYRHQLQVFAGYEHFTQAIVDEWADGAEYLNQFTRPENPREITYKLVPALVNAVNTVTADGVAYNFNPDGAYWVDNLSVREGGPQDDAVFGQIDITSNALPAPQTILAPTTKQGVSLGAHSTPYVANGLQWIETGQAPLANSFSATLTNLASATLDISRMALDTTATVTGTLQNDGVTNLTLTQISTPVDIYVNQHLVGSAAPGVPAVVSLESGASNLYLVPPGTTPPPPSLPAESFAVCLTEPADPSCPLSSLAGLLSVEGIAACGQDAVGEDCPLSSLIQPLADNDPVGVAQALSAVAANVSACIEDSDPLTCQQVVMGSVEAAAIATGLPLSQADNRCDVAPSDPDPINEPLQWQTRDLLNILCSTQRLTDMAANPAFALRFGQETPRTFSDNIFDQIDNPTRPAITLAQVLPGGTTADPFRGAEDWEAGGRGQVQDISFIATSGAKLNGRLFTPNPEFDAPYPVVIITTGSIQAYQEVYNWAAQGLAEAGYLVMTYDVQGQGESETFPHAPDGSIACGLEGCEGVPFQQDSNFFQGARDSLDFLLSTPTSPYGLAVPAASQDNPNARGTNAFNPLWAQVDRQRIGLAGHSLGASAVSVVGQERGCALDLPMSQRDGCVSALVGWDAVSTVSDDVPLRVPALSLTADYFLNPIPANPQDPPDPDTNLGFYNQLTAAGIDAMHVALRSSTHLEWTYIPYILPASRYGERASMHYTLAWFDRYLRADASADARLTTLRFNGSADQSAIGAGTYDLSNNINVPYRIEGDCVANRLSIYQRSAYSLEGGSLLSSNLRARGCSSGL